MTTVDDLAAVREALIALRENLSTSDVLMEYTAAAFDALDRLAARLEETGAALREARALFVELRSDWSDNRGPCREGIEIINDALGEDKT